MDLGLRLFCYNLEFLIQGLWLLINNISGRAFAVVYCLYIYSFSLWSLRLFLLCLVTVSLCISVLIRRKHKTKCQFQWTLLVDVLWLLESFRVNAVTDNCYRLPSPHLILTMPLSRGGKKSRYMGWQTIWSSLSGKKLQSTINQQKHSYSSQTANACIISL